MAGESTQSSRATVITPSKRINTRENKSSTSAAKTRSYITERGSVLAAGDCGLKMFSVTTTIEHTTLTLNPEIKYSVSRALIHFLQV